MTISAIDDSRERQRISTLCDLVFTAHVFSFLNVSSYKHVASSHGSDTESIRMA